MRKKRLAKNAVASLMNYFIVLICSFLLPRFILKYFGSEVNGVVISIGQFLGIISFLELGMGSVVPAALYKPLSDRDNESISRILHSASKFYRRIAYILIAYIAVLIVLYPRLIQGNHDPLYLATLIIAIGINSFGQYYFGIVDRLLLSADQHGYIFANIQSVTLILNTIISIVLILLGASIHVVKYASALVFLIRPLCLRAYVNRHYQIDRHILYSGEPIQQKWNGVAQHVAAFVLDGTDNIVLTVFTPIVNVSVYSAYHLVLNGITCVLSALTSGTGSLMGELWAKKEMQALRNLFGWYEWCIHSASTFAFSCAAVLIVPFVIVYTKGVQDANYNQPIFSAVILGAYWLRSVYLPYILMILAAGHYKQTQYYFIIAAVINMVLSVLLVHQIGLVGVAIGTLAAMLFQTAWMAWYNSKNLVEWEIASFLKQVAVDLLSAFLIIFFGRFFSMSAVNYFSWIVMALKVSVVAGVIELAVNFVFYRDRLAKLKSAMISRLSGNR